MTHRNVLVVTGDAVVVGGAVGVLTAYGQGWLGDGLGSLANSAGPWAVAATAVAVVARRPVAAVFVATLVLICCELGYAVTTIVRGASNGTSTVVLWLLAALLAGPPLGLAAAWGRSTGGVSRRAIGRAVLPGVLVGEAIWGLAMVADTTSPAYWSVELLVGLAAIVTATITAARRSTRPGPMVALTMATAAATAGVVLVGAHFL